MAEIILDLSGQAGLAENYAGDTDMVTPQPELRLAKSQSDIVSGMFNPLLRKGYLSPVVTSSTNLTIDTVPTTILGSVEYDYLNDAVYWADRENHIYKGDSITDTSLTLVGTLEDGTWANQKYDEIHDLQIYQINGVRRLFFVGKGLPEGGGPDETLATMPTDTSWVTLSAAYLPSGLTKPTVVADTRGYSGSSGSSLTKSFTVPSGTDQVLSVIVMWSSNRSAPDCTWNGTTLNRRMNYSVGPSTATYELANPTAGTGNIVVTWDSNEDDRLLYGLVVRNVNQTDIANYEADSESAAQGDSTVTFETSFINQNQLLLVAGMAGDEWEPSSKLGTEYYDEDNTYRTVGADGLWEVNTVGYGLQVGYGDLPFTGSSGSEASWLASRAVGAFLQELDSNYAFMRTADNGFAYIFADNHVHMIDGTITGGEEGTVTKNVLLFPEYFSITDAIDYRSRLYIAIHQYPVDIDTTTLRTFRGECGIYVWNRISSQLSSADYIELPGVREIKKIYASPDGQLKLLVISDNGLVEIRQFGYNDSGGVVFPTAKSLGIGAYPQFPDGLSTTGDGVMWLANDGKIYSEAGNAVTQLYEAKAQGTTTATTAYNIEAGALFYGSGDQTADAGYRSNKQALTFSYMDGATHYLKKVYPFDIKDGSNAAQSQGQGDVYTGVSFIPFSSDIRNIRVYNAPTQASGSSILATVKVYFNQGTNPAMPDGMTKTITQSEAKRGYVDFKINKQYIHAIQIEIEWNTSIPLGDDTYHPSVAVVTHDVTSTESPDNG